MIEIRLKEILESRDMSLAKLHELTGISQNTLGLISNGKNKGIQFETLEKILDALNLDIEDIFKRYSHKSNIYAIGIDNDYSPLKERENRYFRFNFMNLTEDGEEQFLYDLTFSVHYFNSQPLNKIGLSKYESKYNLYISFYDEDVSRECENPKLAFKLNHLFEDRSGLYLISYLIVDDVLRELELHESVIIATVNWYGFERDNATHLDVQVPLKLDLKEKRNSSITDRLKSERSDLINLPAFEFLIEEFSNLLEVIYIQDLPYIKALY